MSVVKPETVKINAPETVITTLDNGMKIASEDSGINKKDFEIQKIS